MKKNLQLSAILGSAFALATVANAAPAQIDLGRVIDGAIETIDTSTAQQPEQKLDISKVNAVLAAAKDKVIVDFADFIASANASFNAATFNLDTLTVDLSSDVTIKKSVWSQLPTTVALDFGTKLLGEQGAQQLAGELGLSLRTQTLVLIKYGANLILEQNPVEENDTEEDVLARGYFTDIKNAADMDAVFARTFALRDQVLASTSEALASLRETFADLTFTADDGEMNVDLKEMEFSGVKLSASFVVNGSSASAKIKAIDIGNSLKEQIEENKAEITKFLIQIQNPTDEIRTEIEDGFRSLFSGAKEIVGIDEAK